MANSKNKNIILGVVVITIWGAIGFKVISYLNKNSIVELPTTNVFKTAGIKLKKEKFLIEASYNDPFLKDIKDKTIQPLQTQQFVGNRVEFQPLKPKSVWPEIKYNGVVETSSKDKRIGLLQIEKKDYLISEGDSVSSLKIIKIYKDSLRLKFNQELKTYSLQKIN